MNERTEGGRDEAPGGAYIWGSIMTARRDAYKAGRDDASSSAGARAC